MLREMRAERVAFLVVHRVLEQRAEDFRLDLGPVLLSGFFQQIQFDLVNLDARRFFEQAAIEVGNAFEAPARFRPFAVHGLEQPADDVVTVRRGFAFREQVRDEVFRQQADVLGKERHEHLQDEFLRHVARFAALEQGFETFSQLVGGLRGDGDAVVFKIGFGIARREEFERSPALRQILERERVLGRVEVRVEIVNAELVEVAEHDVTRAIGHEARPVIEGLTVMFLEILAALFHFDEHDGFPDVIGEGRPTAVFVGFADAEFRRATYIKRTALAEGLEEAVEEDLRLALFIAGDVIRAPCGEFEESFPARHGGVLQQTAQVGKAINV